LSAITIAIREPQAAKADAAEIIQNRTDERYVADLPVPEPNGTGERVVEAPIVWS